VEAPGEDSTISQVGERHPCTPADSSEEAYAGAITVRTITPVDTIKQFVKDTLTALRILPKQVLKIYPNPISRGSTFHLAWQSEPGAYNVRLISVNGALVQSRVVQVGTPSQIDTWEMPGALVAGVYILQVIRPGQTGSFSQKVIVE